MNTLLAAAALACVVAAAGPVGADEAGPSITAQGPTKVRSAQTHDGSAFGATQRLKVVCPEGAAFLVRVEVTQPSGRSLTGGTGITCTGRVQHLSLPLSLGPGSSVLLLDLTMDADLLAVLVSLAGGAGAADSGRTRPVLAAHAGTGR